MKHPLKHRPALPLFFLLVLAGSGALFSQTLTNTREIKDTNGVVTATSRIYTAPDSGVIEVMHIPSDVSYDILINIPDSTRAFIKFMNSAGGGDLDSAIVRFTCRTPCRDYRVFSIDDRSLRKGN